MKVIVIGASGRIGGAICSLIEADHELVRVGRSSGDVQADYTNVDSVNAMFEQCGAFDALVCVAGNDSSFKPYEELTDEDYLFGFQRKFLSQIRLVKLGEPHANHGAQFILSSGFLSHYPNSYSLATGPLNAAVDAFAMSTAALSKSKIRVNVVSPAPIVPPERAGRGLITAEQAAEKYVALLNSNHAGHVVRAWGGLENDPLPGSE